MFWGIGLDFRLSGCKDSVSNWKAVEAFYIEENG